ncbi:MAG TPA: hypothetical protein PKH58_07260 [Paludibacteraceae bacterium]|jgi:hypothetical protein|nr:hypothetical protein [Paludibacteraceae bacterium]
MWLMEWLPATYSLQNITARKQFAIIPGHSHLATGGSAVSGRSFAGYASSYATFSGEIATLSASTREMSTDFYRSAAVLHAVSKATGISGKCFRIFSRRLHHFTGGAGLLSMVFHHFSNGIQAESVLFHPFSGKFHQMSAPFRLMREKFHRL